MSTPKEYIFTPKFNFTRLESQKSTEYYMSKRRYPHKMYYVHNSKKTIIAKSNYFFTKSSVQYTVTSRHSSLIAMTKDLKNKISQCEYFFQEYLTYVLSNNESKENPSLQKLLDSLKSIHPFFSHDQNAIYYVQEKVKYYFMLTLNFYLIDSNEEKNRENVRKHFDAAMQPTLCELKKNTEDVKSLDTLWSEFYYYILDIPTESPFLKVSDRQFDAPQNIIILKSLFELEEFLTEYVLLFHSIAAPHTHYLSKGQLFCLLMRSPGSITFFNEINKVLRLSDPDTLFMILMNAMENNYKNLDTDALAQLYQDFYKERYNITDPDILAQATQKFIYDKELSKKQISIDSDYIKLDNMTCDMYAFFQNTNTPTFQKSCKPYYTFLNEIIRPDWDILFETDIYEAYTFEQLIYLELYHMLKDGAYVCECAAPNCNRRFITHTVKTKYCPACSDKNIGASRLYQDKINDRFHQIQRLLYNHCRYQLRNLPKESQEKIELGKWRGDVSNDIINLSIQERADKSNAEFLCEIYSKMKPILKKHVDFEKLEKSVTKIK